MAQTAPHSRSNWLLPQILLGAIPISSTIPKILEAGITVFVDLLPLGESKYKENLPSHIEVINFPIASGRAPSLKSTRELIAKIIILMASKSIYIHCQGGHGRTGLIGAILYGQINNVSAGEAIRAVELSRNSRTDQSRNFIPTPETTAQVNLVGKILGLDPQDPLPDRSNTSWMKRVKSERNNKTMAEEEGVIRFYTDKLYGEFSNYYIHKDKLIFYNKKYASAEHIFQAAKFIYPGASPASREYGHIVRKAKTPNIARELASQKIKGGYSLIVRDFSDIRFSRKTNI